MKATQVRDSIAKYYLVATFFMGGYILLFGGKGTALLPVDDATARDCLQIIIPVLVGQITMIYRFYADKMFEGSENITVNLRPWIVRWPAWGSGALIVVTVLLMATATGTSVAPDQEQFKQILTFSVTLTNATLAFLVVKLFDARQPTNHREPAPPTSPRIDSELDH